MSEEYDNALTVVFSYAKHVDSWIIIKKELLKNLPASARKAFSTRHPITKKQQTNDFERDLASKWEVMSGRSVVFNIDEDVTISKNST